VILIPHRDAARLVEDYRRSLFGMGFAGAHSFPVAAPLCRSARPLTGGELRTLSQNLRAFLERRGGFFRADWTPAAFPLGNSAMAGLPMKPEFEQTTQAAVQDIFPPSCRDEIEIFPRAALCAAVLGPGEEVLLEKAPSCRLRQPLVFRAAMTANLFWKPLGAGAAAYSFQWETSAPAWLPKTLRGDHG